MEAFMGRELHVPRAVFASYIEQGCSEEPPNAEFWKGAVMAVHPTRKRPFLCDLTILELDDEDVLFETQESHNFTLAQLRDFIVLRGDEDRSTVGAPPATLLPRKKTGLVKRKASDVFATPDGKTRCFCCFRIAVT